MIRYIKENIEDDFNEFDFGGDISSTDSKWYKDVEIPKECVKGVTLLSKEEYKECREYIQNINCSWWLRSPGLRNCYACLVSHNGNAFRSADVDSESIGIRPVLILDTKSLDVSVGDNFEFGGYCFTLISNNLALCFDIVGKSCFNKDAEKEGANVYEQSDVKKIVDDWFDDIMFKCIGLKTSKEIFDDEDWGF